MNYQPRPPPRLAVLADIPDGRCLGIAAGTRGLTVDVFLVRRGPSVRAYVNSCPHIGLNLEWQPHDFLDPEGRHIQCKTHGALFRIDDGHCISGPCAGRALRRCEIEVIDGAITLIAPPPPPYP